MSSKLIVFTVLLAANYTWYNPFQTTSKGDASRTLAQPNLQEICDRSSKLKRLAAVRVNPIFGQISGPADRVAIPIGSRPTCHPHA